MPDIQHKDIPDSQLHEAKGAASAQAGEVLTANGDGTATFQAVKGLRMGWYDYNDNVTATSPLNAVADTWLYLTNDGLGGNTNRVYGLAGLAEVYDTVNQRFDWTGLKLGDTFDIRVDIEITTTTANQEYELAMELAQSSGSPYTLQLAQGLKKTAGVTNLVTYWGGYMGNLDTLNSHAKLKLITDAAATVKVNGWYVRVITKE